VVKESQVGRAWLLAPSPFTSHLLPLRSNRECRHLPARLVAASIAVYFRLSTLVLYK
jgi:hypothetical protein